MTYVSLCQFVYVNLSCIPLPTPKEITPKFFSGFPLQLLTLWDMLPLSFFRRESINLFTFGTGHRVGNFMCCCLVDPHCVLLIIVICLLILAIFAAFHLTNIVDIQVLCSIMFPDMSRIASLIFTHKTLINTICIPPINMCNKLLLGVTSPATVTCVLWRTLGNMGLSVIKRIVDVYIVDIWGGTMSV